MAKKILFVTPDYSFFTQPVTAALRRLNYQVITFDYYKPNIFSRLVGLVGNLGLINRTYAQRKTIAIVNHSLLDRVNSFKPDYLLVIKGETITSATIKAIGAKGVVTINWYSDWFDSWKWIINHAPDYHLFINMCRETHRRLKRVGINSFYLPVASYIDDPPIKLEQKYPISFVGAYTPRRERYLKTLKDLGLKIWGYNQWQQSSLKDIAHGPVSVAQSRQIIRQSKITVNLVNGSDTKQPDQINTRIVETTSVGSFLLTKDSPALRRYFRPGKEVAVFTNPQDLQEKVNYYLKHDSVRERMARAGYLRTKKDHTFDTRLRELFKLVKLHTS